MAVLRSVWDLIFSDYITFFGEQNRMDSGSELKKAHPVFLIITDLGEAESESIPYKNQI